jgi:UPF0148 protein
LKKITRLLEKGCTMLANHHDCGAPLFRCNGKILCPICSSSTAKADDAPIEETNAVVTKDADETKGFSNTRAGDEEALASSVEHVKSFEQEDREDDRHGTGYTNMDSEGLGQNSCESPQDSEFEIIKQSVKTAVLFRLKDLALDIKEEKDLCRLRDQLDCADAALKLISALK